MAPLYIPGASMRRFIISLPWRHTRYPIAHCHLVFLSRLRKDPYTVQGFFFYITFSIHNLTLRNFEECNGRNIARRDDARWCFTLYFSATWSPHVWFNYINPFGVAYRAQPLLRKAHQRDECASRERKTRKILRLVFSRWRCARCTLRVERVKAKLPAPLRAADNRWDN